MIITTTIRMMMLVICDGDKSIIFQGELIPLLLFRAALLECVSCEEEEEGRKGVGSGRYDGGSEAGTVYQHLVTDPTQIDDKPELSSSFNVDVDSTEEQCQ